MKLKQMTDIRTRIKNELKIDLELEHRNEIKEEDLYNEDGMIEKER